MMTVVVPTTMDTLIAGAILCDIGKLLEYDKNAKRDLVTRTIEATIVHHADFVSFNSLKTQRA
jgi:23S rRNA maturation-related 3'-5' exoribonuclease YhaM